MYYFDQRKSTPCPAVQWAERVQRDISAADQQAQQRADLIAEIHLDNGAVKG